MACSRCNGYKHDRMIGIDPLSGNEAELFNPRTRPWEEHFEWVKAGLEINGLTPTGRATVAMLKMNDSLIVAARSLWIQWGVHPPST